jgi:phosphatidylinositol alpha 1,6-mannosyltransferase
LTLAPSTASADDLLAHGVARVGRWGRGVNLDLFSPTRRQDAPPFPEAVSSDAEGRGGGIVVGYVGRLAREKSVELLAPVSQLPGVTLVVVGDGPIRAELERAMPRAHFLGVRHGEELAAVYAGLDLFVHTGPHETFCQTVQEALASGVPVVAPAKGGPLDLVTHGRNGLLVPPGDSAALASAVAMLAADAPLRRRYAANARPSVEGRDWAAIVDDMIGHYEAVTGHPRTVAAAPAAPAAEESAPQTPDLAQGAAHRTQG